MAHRIAFTSCMDTVHDDEQRGWDELAAQQPHEIVLLGDSIYMDYGWPPRRKEPNGSPRHLSLADFSARLHARYKAQYEVAAFRRAITGRRVHAVWDDHDFAWNNSRGAGPDGEDRVSDDQRRVSREQFEAWREAPLQQPATYPADRVAPGSVPADRGSIARTEHPLPGVALHLADCRSFRQPVGGTLLGAAQRQALEQAFRDDVVHIVAGGSSLEEEWTRHDDLPWLQAQARQRRVLYITGDIHQPAIRSDGRLHELVASAMAQGPWFGFLRGKKQRVFGLIEIEDATLGVKIFHKGRLADQARIDRRSWALTRL